MQMEQMAQNRMHRIYRQCLRTVAVAVTVTMKGNSSQNRMCQMLHLLVTVIGVPNANVVCIKHNFSVVHEIRLHLFNIRFLSDEVPKLLKVHNEVLSLLTGKCYKCTHLNRVISVI